MGSWMFIDNNTERAKDTLARVVRIRNQANTRVDAMVMEARANGVSWTEIGKALGVSRQAATEKYGKKNE